MTTKIKMTSATVSKGVKERPILFSGPMVRAILDGSKTQTRRVMKLDGAYNDPPKVMDNESPHYWSFASGNNYTCPYGESGDRLWVRETFYHSPDFHGHAMTWFRADMLELPDCGGGWNWKPSIFMPRNLSRIILEITDVRVERLQAISEEDAKAEGVGPEFEIDFATFIHGKNWNAAKASTHYLGFKHLWDSINKERGFGWDKNPWVWAITFKRLE